MTDEQVDRLAVAIVEHGNQLGHNMVHLKRFLDAKQSEQHAFLEEQRLASDKAQEKAHRTARWSAAAAGLAAAAAIAQAVFAIWR